jgi:alpha-mannosidase
MYFTLRKLEKRLPELWAAVSRDIRRIDQFRCHGSDVPHAAAPDFDDREWDTFTVGDTWGGYDSTVWFRTRVPIPDGWREHKLALRFLVGPRDGGGSTAETMLYVNGVPLQAIDVWHEHAWLLPEHTQSGEVLIALKAWSGVLNVPDRRRFKLAQLVWIDEPAERLYYLMSTLVQAIKLLGEEDFGALRMLQALNEAYHLIDFAKPKSERFYDSLEAAYEVLLERVTALEQFGGLKPRVVGIGHAHIDLAWLWRLRHTREKAARTFATALHLMRQYPDYRFMHSSPQLYKYLQADYPDLFERVKERIAAGQWEITGATWVEPDVNIPSGESLVRQFLFGRRYVRDTFGKEMSVLWLPDVFGYSYALPQIIRKSGVDFFLTSKISWNQYNRFPHDTFRWRGLDGTEVLTHFITSPDDNGHTYTYNAQVRPFDVKGSWDQYRQKAVNDELLLLYGWGDGGGGPTQEMIENARWQKNLPGIPSVELDSSERFFARLADRVADQPLPVWDGELYLEYHRGTYTSQAYNKRANRKSEVLYHNAEWLSALASLLTPDFTYPAESLNAGWELILLNQFHDILPGSSIHDVYTDSREDYAQIAQIGEAAAASALDALTEQISVDEDSVIVFNPLPWDWYDLIELPNTDATTGKTISRWQSQFTANKTVLMEATMLPPMGYSVKRLDEPLQILESTITVTPSRLENRYYRIELNECGQITALYDKVVEREVLAPGQVGNVFQTFEDKPMAFDAWDIDLYYQEKMHAITELVEAVVEEEGPLRGSLRLVWKYGDSTITQRISLYSILERIDFRTEIDWHEQQTLLKVAFPVNIRATRATYDIQFGSIERPTHWNTSWDQARFEVVGHKWADLSEGDYGVALLNDCKYGYDIHDNVMRLTLIKSAIDPDPTADQGHHEFIYSLLPHKGDWRIGQVAMQASALNNPLIARIVAPNPNGSLPDKYSFAALDTDNVAMEDVVIETVKRAEDGDGWIVRVYENQQSRHDAVTITFAQPIREATECNLVEEGESPVRVEGSTLTFAISPFEIKTFRIKFK